MAPLRPTPQQKARLLPLLWNSCKPLQRRDRALVPLGGLEFIVPSETIAADQSARGSGPPAPGDVRLDPLVMAHPPFTDRIYPPPRRVQLIAAHEQGQIAFDDIHDEPLVGVHWFFFEGPGQI